MIFNRTKNDLPDESSALRGRSDRPFDVSGDHRVLGTPVVTDVPDGLESVVVGLGCFWGEEKTFWEIPGVWSTSVGYAGGVTPNPTYDEVCSGRTGHVEVVRVIYDPALISFSDLLKVFWENHDPTQGMRQGNDRGTQYRSVIYTTTPDQQAAAEKSRMRFQTILDERGYGQITTTIAALGEYYYAENDHQQYLAKNPFGYCPLHATGVTYD